MININDTTIFYGSCTDQCQLGTGFAVHKNIVTAVKKFKAINPRINMLTIEAQWFDISFINEIQYILQRRTNLKMRKKHFMKNWIVH